jgi:hypothetical protein
MNRDTTSRLLRAGLLTGIVDGLWACVLAIGFYHSTFTRLWQGVASVPLGKDALAGGTATTLIGLFIHFVVAFTWSAIFLFVGMRSSWIRAQLASPNGVLKIAALYGPFIWIVMSLAVIPLLTHRSPTITIRWFVQLIGHILFVGLPIVWSIGRPTAREGVVPTAA